MTFDLEPDLDNANVGMPDARISGRTKYTKEVTKSVASFFVFGGVYMVKINGEEKNIAGKTLAEYLENTSYDSKRIAVERNGNIVPKAQYAEIVLQDGDNVEIVSFVGGG